MVFGNTYCAISRLEIKDGDKCIAIPLKFNLGGSFEYYNKASVNTFLYLYEFCDEPFEVIYEGNYSMLSAYCKRTDKWIDYMRVKHVRYELIMLVRTDVYEAILEKSNCSEKYKVLHNVPGSFKTVTSVHQKWSDLMWDNMHSISYKNAKTPIEDIELEKRKAETPLWIRNIFGFAEYIDRLGMIPYPNISVDQHSVGREFWEIIDIIREKN